MAKDWKRRRNQPTIGADCQIWHRQSDQQWGCLGLQQSRNTYIFQQDVRRIRKFGLPIDCKGHSKYSIL